MKQAISGSNSQCEVIDIMPYVNKRKREEEIESEEDVSISEVLDALMQLVIVLDCMGHFKYADKISDVIGEMFEDNQLTT